MAEKIPFFSGDLNGNGKSGFFEKVLGLDPGIRALAGAWRGVTGRNQTGTSTWDKSIPSQSIPRQNFGMTQSPWQVQDFTNSFSAPSSGLQGQTQPWSNPYKRQEFGLTAQQPQQAPQQPQDMFDPNGLTQFTNTGLPFLNNPLRPTPNKMPVRNDLDFMDTAGSSYQSRFSPSYQNPMTANNGYFDMNKASTAGGNWIQGVGWRTDANKAMGQTEEDMAFNAQMAQRLGNMAQ